MYLRYFFPIPAITVVEFHLCDRTIMPIDLGSIHNSSYQVFAIDKPEELGGEESMIGELVLTSNLTTSKWGDTGLFFRHQD